MTVQSSRATGSVDRVGERLVVESPPDMGPNAWGVITQELLLFARAEELSATSIGVPVDQAGHVRQVLEQPWPGRMWPWEWSRAAEQAVGRSQDLDSNLGSLLNPEVAPRVLGEDVRAELAVCGFRRRLLAAQADAVGRLVAAGSGGNFSVPGSGKTTMTLALYVMLRARGLVDRLLVVAPTSAYEAWTTEPKACFQPGRAPSVEVTPRLPMRSVEIVVYNYERVAMGSVRAAVDAWSHGRRLMVVYDEAHRAKRGEDGLHGAAARDLSQMAVARFVLTGTPMPNSRSDLAAILDLAWPGQGNRLADPSTPRADRTWVRITKHDLELTDPVIEVEHIELDPAHRSIYEALTSGLHGDSKLLEAFPSLASKATTRLLAAAANPALLLDASNDTELRWTENLNAPDSIGEILQRLPSAVRPAKLLRVAQYAAEHHERGEKLLVWTNFLGNVRELQRILAPWHPAVITGDVPLADTSAPRDRVRELARFRTDDECTVLIATPQTLGEGVSLHHICQSQIHLDRSFNAGLFLQAIDRTHRIGMPDGTTARVRVLVAKDTIDEVVHERLRRKVEQMNTVLDDPALRRLSLPGDDPEPSRPRLSEAEIADLLRHLRA